MDLKSRVDDLLLRLGPSETALLDWLGPRIDEALLVEIADADYGTHATEYYEALKRIHEGKPLPVPLRWCPREALNLTRWSEPDDPEYGPPPNSKGTRGHLMRAFCCAVLLKAADEPGTRDYIDSEIETLIQLIGSVLHLGSEASESALRFLCWRVFRLPPEDDAGERPFFAFAVLLLRAAVFGPHQDGADLSLLVDWVVAEELRARMRPLALPESEEWLLGLTNFDLRHKTWRRLASEVLLDPAQSFPDPAATAMRGIVQRLVPEIG